MAVDEWLSGPLVEKDSSSGFKTRKCINKKWYFQDHWFWFFDTSRTIRYLIDQRRDITVYALWEINRSAISGWLEDRCVCLGNHDVWTHYQDASLHQSEKYQDTKRIRYYFKERSTLQAKNGEQSVSSSPRTPGFDHQNGQ